MTALRPGASPPPVLIPIRIEVLALVGEHFSYRAVSPGESPGARKSCARASPGASGIAAREVGREPPRGGGPGASRATRWSDRGRALDGEPFHHPAPGQAPEDLRVDPDLRLSLIHI